MMMLKMNENKRIENCIYTVCLMLLFICASFLFYRQAVQYNDMYESDLHYYVNIAVNGEGDRFLSIVMGQIYALTGSIKSLAVFLGLEIVGIALAADVLMTDMLKLEGIGVSSGVVKFFSLIIVFSGNIYVPFIHHYFYRKSWDSFAWHSPTQQTMILFAFLTMIFFLRMCNEYRNGIKAKNWIAVLIFSVPATWAKPSFFMVACPALITAFLVELAGTDAEERRKVFGKLVVMGLSMVPAGFVMLYYALWYGGKVGDSEVVFGLKRFLEVNSQDIVINICCGLAIPVLVLMANLIFDRGRFRKFNYRFALLMFMFGVLEWVFIYETGRNANYGNFGWGKQFACLNLFLVSYVTAIANHKNESFMAEHRTLRKGYFLLFGCGLAYMLVSQLYFFAQLLTGSTYMI